MTDITQRAEQAEQMARDSVMGWTLTARISRPEPIHPDDWEQFDAALIRYATLRYEQGRVAARQQGAGWPHEYNVKDGGWHRSDCRECAQLAEATAALEAVVDEIERVG